jgi:hypothetical protein
MKATLHHRRERHLRAKTWLDHFIHDNSRLWAEIAADLLYIVDSVCSRKLAAGSSHIFGSISDLRLAWDKRIEQIEIADADPKFCDELFDLTLDRLVDQGDLVFVNDRQRMRSRTYENIHYLRHLRQRLDPTMPIDSAAGLVEMVKAETVQRQRPERNYTVDDLCDVITEAIYADGTPPIGDGIENFTEIALDTLELFRSFLARIFPGESRFSGFQVRSTDQLIRAVLRKEGACGGLAIAAGTGFGKTEAFAFPILYNAVLTKVVQAIRGKRGTSAILLYPRRDLCNDQAGRLSGYLVELNAVLKDRWSGLVHDGTPFRPLRLALAHGGFSDAMRVSCPLCQAERRINPDLWTPQDEQLAQLVADPKSRKFQDGFEGLFQCERSRGAHQAAAETLVFQIHYNSEDADLIVSTVDTLHRRLMDGHGRERLFKATLTPPRFVVLDEMHIYDGQTGAHAAQIVRRLRQRVRGMTNGGIDPIAIGASATIADPADLLHRLSGVGRERISVERPQDDEVVRFGLEHYIFVQSPGNKLVDPRGDDDEADVEDDQIQSPNRRFVSEQATMIQSAMCLQHNMKAPAGAAPQKRRVLGFVDSLDVSARLARNIDNAEWQDAGPGTIAGGGPKPIKKAPLFSLRLPAGRADANQYLKASILASAQEIAPGQALGQLTFPDPGRDCPRLAAGIECRQPPHHLIEPCLRYESGECWYVMARRGEEGLWPLAIQTHQSGRRTWAFPSRRYNETRDRESWRLLVSTSALEVGFDHRELIATWQYHAPPSVSAFVQRKGRGGRDAGDYPITMMVLGVGSSDVFAFQHHGRYVAVGDRDLVCWIDPNNPSIRAQHMVAAIFDFCAARISQKAYSKLDFTVLLEALRDQRHQLISWLCATCARNHEEAANVIDTLTRTVSGIWDAPLKLPPGLGWGAATPVRLFAQRSSDQLRTAGMSLPDDPIYRDTRTWLLALAKGCTSEYPTAPDFFSSLPDEMVEDPDLRVPPSTISEPLGRQIRVLNDSGTYIGSDPAEFILGSFLPGGFKIRYNGRMWMCPWQPAPGYHVNPGSNLTWAALVLREPGAAFQTDNPHLETARPRRRLDAFLAESTDLASERRDELLELIGQNASLASISAVHLQEIGGATARRFTLDETTLTIVRSATQAGPQRTLLARDPHLTAQRIVIPLRPRQTESILPIAPFRSLHFHAEQSLAVIHYANLVHCYPAGTPGERTIVVRFCAADATTQPFCPGIVARTQAIELAPDPAQIPKLSSAQANRIFWTRVKEKIVAQLVIGSARLQSAYMVEGCVDALAALEDHAGSFREAPPTAPELIAKIDVTVSWLRELADLRPYSNEIAKLLSEASTWVATQGAARAYADTLAAALIRAGADALNLSPNTFRQLVEPHNDGWRILIYDDNEGGSGNCRRLWETMKGWPDLYARLTATIRCPVAKADEAIAKLLTIHRSADALALLRAEGQLSTLLGWTPDAATRLRLERMFDGPEISAFQLYAFGEWSELIQQLGGPPPLAKFVRHVHDTFALDPRAESLRHRFIEYRVGGVSELPSRLRAVMPLCESGCAYCIGSREDGDFSDRTLLQA